MQTRDAKPPARSSQTDEVAGADDKEQSRLFLAKARELGSDGDHSDADELLRQMALVSPKPRKTQASE